MNKEGTTGEEITIISSGHLFAERNSYKVS